MLMLMPMLVKKIVEGGHAMMIITKFIRQARLSLKGPSLYT
jgi:hypothetical protein